jgi:glycosyltransferase involved in cell wall biosynthesis
MSNFRGPLLSTVVLNWNRASVLERTLRSYVATVSVEHETIVVDNGSTDDSRRVIEDARERGWIDGVILLTENLGGEAINLGLDRLSGQFLHVSENDVEYEPGWDRVLLKKFDLFPRLGQISPFGPAPRAAAGEVGPIQEHEIFGGESGRICVASRGVTTTCLLRRTIFDEGGRWSSICSGQWRWPNDGAFSMRVKAQGYWVAWNDVPVAVNVGHTVTEWNRDFAYYADSYDHKRWVGMPGWEARLARAGYRLVVEDGRSRIIRGSTGDGGGRR